MALPESQRDEFGDAFGRAVFIASDEIFDAIEGGRPIKLEGSWRRQAKIIECERKGDWDDLIGYLKRASIACA